MLYSSSLEDVLRGILQETKRDFMCQLHEIVHSIKSMSYVQGTSGKFQKHNSNIKEILIELLIACFVNV